MFHKVSSFENCLDWDRGRLSELSVQKPFRLTSRNSSDFSKNLWYRKISRIRRAVRLSPLSVEIFVSQQTEMFRRGPILCFRIFLVPLVFIDKKGRENHHDFLSKLFCLTVPKLLIEEPFCGSETLRYGKFSSIKGGYQDFRPKIFCLTVPEHFLGERFSVSESFRYRSAYQDVPSNFFCLTFW